MLDLSSRKHGGVLVALSDPNLYHANMAESFRGFMGDLQCHCNGVIRSTGFHVEREESVMHYP